MVYSIPSLVQFGQLIGAMKNTIFKNFGNSRKFPYEKLIFFLGKLNQKFLLFNTLPTQGILHTEFGLISTTP